MALPAFDDFNRADGGVGANWTNLSDAFMVVGNCVQPLSHLPTPPSHAIWSADLVPTDHYAQLTVASLGTGTQSQLVGPAVRMSAGCNAYWLTIVDNGVDANLILYSYVAGNGVLLQSTSTTSLVVAGDVLRLSIVGSMIKFFKNGEQHGFDVTDSTHITGVPGLMSWRLTDSLGDDWECGIDEPIEQDLMSIRQRMV